MAALRDVEDWLERYRRFWESSFDRMDGYLAELKVTDPHRETPQRHSKGDDDGA
jgi:hypothetical protein